MRESGRGRFLSLRYGSSVSEVMSVRCSSEEKNLQNANTLPPFLSIEALAAALLPVHVDEENCQDEHHKADHRENEQEEEGECAHAFIHHLHCNTKSGERVTAALRGTLQRTTLSL